VQEITQQTVTVSFYGRYSSLQNC